MRSYRYERRTELAFPILGAMMEGGFIGVIADKVYAVHPAVLALISASPLFGQLLSVFWARLALGRRKVPVITALQSTFVVTAGTIAILPEGPLGAWMLVISLIAARLVLGGIITVRSVVWSVNYPRESRGRITSRLQVLTMLTMTSTSFLGGMFLDANPESFRIVYAAGALLSTFGVLSFSRVRIRDEHAQLEREQQLRKGDGGATPAALGTALRVLREDPAFARYQGWLFLAGAANMMIEAPLIYLVSRELQASYTTSIALTLGLPLGLALVTLPLWATYIDRVHVAEFRARNGWIFVSAHILTWIGAVQGSLLWVALGRTMSGLGRGGGSLAWQLGHNDFARSSNVGLYMGVHVTLTGVRGALAPFAGMLLYVGWSSIEIPGIGLRAPGFDGIGGHTMGIAALAGTVGTIGFHRLSKRLRIERDSDKR